MVTKKVTTNIDNLTINSIAMLGVQAVNNAKSGHPGIVLGATAIIYALFKDHLKFNPRNPRWFNRDRFILSAGHGSALLYSMLLHAGYDYEIDDLKKFRTLHSRTPGHPEYNLDLGVEMATGPLGQGIATGVGFALAESFLDARYNQLDIKIIDHYTYVLCSDGDLQEGIAQEALTLAGHWGLKKLIVLYDSNDIQLDAPTAFANSENFQQRMLALNWNYLKVTAGHDYKAISDAINLAKKSDKPTIIEIKTIIGLHATQQGTEHVHGAPLLADIATVKRNMAWNEPDFTIPEVVKKQFTAAKIKQGNDDNEKWNELLQFYKMSYYHLYQEIAFACKGKLFSNNNNFNKIDWNLIINEQAISTRNASGQILQLLTKAYPTLMGGSADLSASTKAKVFTKMYQSCERTGRHISFGVREAAMQAITNGLTLHQGIIAFAATFLIFSDYLKPALRLAAIMKIPALTIFSHDSIAVGEDGPTHQPIEQLTMLRTIPNYNVMRPCDVRETIGAYQIALTSTSYPSAIILTRQDLPSIKCSSIAFVANGAYIVSHENEQQQLDLILIATGSEVHLTIKVKEMLTTKMALNVRVVSMPSTFLFAKQTKNYQDQILPKVIPKVAIELGASGLWYQYVGASGLVIGIDQYGASAPMNALLDYYGFTSEKIYQRVANFMRERNNK